MAKEISKQTIASVRRNGSLLDRIPRVALEWDYEKNGDIRPEMVSIKYTDGSIYWKCPDCGREWQQSPASRVRNGVLNRCAACAGILPIPGKTDLLTIKPTVAREFQITKNNGLKPSDICANSNRKYWWKCSICGREWQATASSRKNVGCNNCNSWHETSFPEQSIFYYCHKYYPDSINKFTSIFDNSMELDIFVPSASLGIEYDGAAWHKGEKVSSREQKKYNICKENGITLIRIREEQVETSNVSCDYCINSKRHISPNYMSPIIEELSQYLPQIKDIDVIRDEIAIREQYASYIHNNSLAVLHPELIIEWDKELNGNLSPEMFLSTSPAKVWWACQTCGKKYQAQIRHRSQGHGCRDCGHTTGAEKKRKYHATKNPFSSVNPNAALEWDYAENGNDTPDSVSANSKTPYHWICGTCGYKWIATPARRNVSGCPKCGVKRAHDTQRSNAIKLHGSLQDMYPELAKEWDYSQNDKSPSDVTATSDESVMWICPNGHSSYSARISNRTILGRGCPVCGRIKAINARNNTILKKNGSLLEKEPLIAAEWDYSKNSTTPDAITSCSNKNFFWICPIGHPSYLASVSSRVSRGCGCPECAIIKRGESIKISK